MTYSERSEDMGTVPHDAVTERMFKEMASVLAKHGKTWVETSVNSVFLNCECGYKESLKNESKAAKAVARHRSSELTEKVKKIAASAWDEGWFDREESSEPPLAGMFLNPYRPVRGFFTNNEKENND